MKTMKWIFWMCGLLFATTIAAQSANSRITDFWNSKQYLMDIYGRDNQRFLKQAATDYQQIHFRQTQIALENAVAENPNSVHALMSRATFKKRFGMEREADLDVKMAEQRNPYIADLYGYDNPYSRLSVLDYQPLASTTGLTLNRRMNYYYNWLDRQYMNAYYEDDEYKQIEIAIYEIEQENYLAAEETVNSLLKQYPNSAIAYDLKGLLMIKLQRMEEATEALAKAVVLAPDFAIAWYNFSRLAHAKGNMSKAKEYLDRAIELQTDLTKAYFDRAILSKKLGNKEAALEDYNRIIKIKGEDYMEAFLNRGLTRKMLGDYTGALNDLNIAIEMNPNNADLYKNRGNIYMVFGQYYQAINEYSKAIQINGNYAEAYYNRGLAGFLVYESAAGCSDLKTSYRLGYERALEMLTYFCQE